MSYSREGRWVSLSLSIICCCCCCCCCEYWYYFRIELFTLGLFHHAIRVHLLEAGGQDPCHGPAEVAPGNWLISSSPSISPSSSLLCVCFYVWVCFCETLSHGWFWYFRSNDSGGASNPGNNLYVTGLSTRVTSSDLEKYFSGEGKVWLWQNHLSCVSWLSYGGMLSIK